MPAIMPRTAAHTQTMTDAPTAKIARRSERIDVTVTLDLTACDELRAGGSEMSPRHATVKATSWDGRMGVEVRIQGPNRHGVTQHGVWAAPAPARPAAGDYNPFVGSVFDLPTPVLAALADATGIRFEDYRP